MNSKIIYSVLVAFIFSIIGGPIFIPILHKLKFGQNIREEGPKSHQKKAGTPTMGGLKVIVASIISMIILVRKPSDEAMFALYAFIAFGFIGFVDDFLKILHKNNLGLRAYQKMLMILLFSFGFGFYAANNPDIGTSIIIPFVGKAVDLGIFYIPFIIIYFAATTNAVNLTDGLDGLATSVTILVMTFFVIVMLSQLRYLWEILDHLP
jgi:phospho-N-acetylmuramoyl-pentapeptide-transferase